MAHLKFSLSSRRASPAAQRRPYQLTLPCSHHSQPAPWACLLRVPIGPGLPSLSPAHPQGRGVTPWAPSTQQMRGSSAAIPISVTVGFSTPSQTKSPSQYLRPGLSPGLGGDLQRGIPAFCVSLLLKLPKEVWYLTKASQKSYIFNYIIMSDSPA